MVFKKLFVISQNLCIICIEDFFRVYRNPIYLSFLLHCDFNIYRFYEIFKYKEKNHLNALSLKSL